MLRMNFTRVVKANDIADKLTKQFLGLSNTFHLILKMTSAQVVKTSVTNNSPFQNYPHPDDHTRRTHFDTQQSGGLFRWRHCLECSLVAGRCRETPTCHFGVLSPWKFCATFLGNVRWRLRRPYQ